MSKQKLNSRCIILLKTEENSVIYLGERLRENIEVYRLSIINDGYDFLIETSFNIINGVKKFIESIEKEFPLLRKEIHYIISTLKENNCVNCTGDIKNET
tara:strand:+ start:198 stop:497 length:300 start_codon:yes stop_codon:yes gene_type:complete